MTKRVRKNKSWQRRQATSEKDIRKYIRLLVNVAKQDEDLALRLEDCPVNNHKDFYDSYFCFVR